MWKRFFLFCLLFVYAAAVIPSDVRQNVSNKIKEITSKIAADIIHKRNGTAQEQAELADALSILVNGAASEIEDKIDAREALKPQTKALRVGEGINTQNQDEAFKEVLQQLKDAYAQRAKDAKEKKNGKATETPNTQVTTEQTETSKEQNPKDSLVQDIIDDIKSAAEKKKAEKEEQKKQLEEQWNQLKPYLDELKDKFEEERKRRVEKASETWKEVSSLLKAFGEQITKKIQQDKAEKQSAREESKKKIEKVIQKIEEKKAAREETKKKIEDAIERQRAQQDSADKAKPSEVVPQARATFLDEITGTSAWQTTTWILLAICILLAIALIFVAISQMRQRNEYQRLPGTDHGDFVVTMDPVPVYPKLKINEEQQF